MSSEAEKAERSFREGFSCSQSVFSVYAEKEGLKRESALKIASSFGAGMCRLGDTCGAVTGALMVLGMKYGRSKPDDYEAKEKNYALASDFIDRFTARFGSRMCRDLLGFDPGSPEGRRRFLEEPELEDRCAGFVKESVSILEGIIESAG
jgi:C_GCAxxG_C_C family probable redox protein